MSKHTERMQSDPDYAVHQWERRWQWRHDPRLRPHNKDFHLCPPAQAETLTYDDGYAYCPVATNLDRQRAQRVVDQAMCKILSGRTLRSYRKAVAEVTRAGVAAQGTEQ